ncbi:hypothetical protein ANCCEY_14179 [Ancylostoma ceylanicum]|uniref:DUF4440 domain-containing protein n=1 Tax=Ancylostoma ceylanicum TaxID=53326 RepID=A0A0D6LAE9_9BILA|nr:hypothetical protein ANCCEY_14179 [Ancylostoma ceylanicum]
MSSCEEAKSILKPIFDQYSKELEEQQFEKVGPYYEPDAVLVHIGKKGTYGREAIMKEFVEFDKLMGKSTTKVSNERYQMAGDYIILSADYETTTEKMGTVKGKFTQVWRKTNNKYMILHDEFSF